jgi:hypothetical protein
MLDDVRKKRISMRHAAIAPDVNHGIIIELVKDPQPSIKQMYIIAITQGRLVKIV